MIYGSNHYCDYPILYNSKLRLPFTSPRRHLPIWMKRSPNWIPQARAASEQRMGLYVWYGGYFIADPRNGVFASEVPASEVWVNILLWEGYYNWRPRSGGFALDVPGSEGWVNIRDMGCISSLTPRNRIWASDVPGSEGWVTIFDMGGISSLTQRNIVFASIGPTERCG